MRMVSKTSYDRCLQTLYGLQRFGIKLGLTTIRNILRQLGNPQNLYASIHVAGTNGKGSVASSLASILREAGYKTGLYTSPHLVRFNERIQVNGRSISNQTVVDLYQTVKQINYGKREATFFEFATAMALFEFGRQEVDWAIIETGMGGRLDATNVIRPEISVITNVSLEHREYLGATLAAIAGEKAGIIKLRTPVITGIRQKKAFDVVEKIAEGKSAPLFRLGKEFSVRRHRSDTFSYRGIENDWHHLQTGLLGNHQVDNAALVLAACEILNRNQTGLTRGVIQTGLLNTRWPGRLEVVGTHPDVILDGAHNLAAARKLANFLAKNFGGRSITLVIGILDDKPYRAMLKSLAPVAQRVILTRARINRALDPEKLRPAAMAGASDVTVIADVAGALAHAVATVSPNDLVCVAGSLYVVGEAKEAIEKGLVPAVKRSDW